MERIAQHLIRLDRKGVPIDDLVVVFGLDRGYCRVRSIAKCIGGSKMEFALQFVEFLI
jgi:hypothetical protein